VAKNKNWNQTMKSKRKEAAFVLPCAAAFEKRNKHKERRKQRNKMTSENQKMKSQGKEGRKRIYIFYICFIVS
jgi:hypothetical protein